MATDRYAERDLIFNDSRIYKTNFFNKGVEFITQYSTPVFVQPDPELASDLEVVKKIWTLGDRMYKIAHKEYGDVNYWWVLALFNGRPTDHHFHPGDIILIPHPLDQVLEMLGV